MLVPRGFDAPLELVEGTSQRGVTVEEVGDAPSVMVALAKGRYLSLVIVEPQAVLELAELIGAVKQYYPAVPVWRYGADERPRLERLTRPASKQNLSSARAQAEQPRSNNGMKHDAEDSGEKDPLRRPAASMAQANGRGIAGRIGPAAPKAPIREPRHAAHGNQQADDGATDRDASRRLPEIKVTLSEEELAMLLGDREETGSWSSDPSDQETRP